MTAFFRFTLRLLNAILYGAMSNLHEEKEGLTNTQIKLPKLWNRNFAILVIGSFISMVGYTCASFAISLSVYDTTGSVLFYALTLVTAVLPKLVVPMIAGTVFDRHSRRKAIPRIDYCYTTLFLTIGLLTHFGIMKYWMFFISALILGTLDGTYMVAFDSLFPLLTTTQNTRKAYSINSMLYPIASIITTPLTLLGYDSIGPVALFLGASVLFAITATVELWIILREPHLVPFKPEEQAKLPPSPRELEYLSQGKDLSAFTARKEKGSFIGDFKEGIKYIAGEKGLLAITIYFFVISLCGGIMGTLNLPYFRSNVFMVGGKAIDGMWAYFIVFGSSTLGRIIGANVQYRIKFPKDIRYNVAVFVYITINITSIIVFHLPVWLMACVMFVEGTLSVTSYNIRISSTSTYVPDDKRGRFNGAFLLFNMLGTILGQLIAGFVGDIKGVTVPVIISIVYIVNLLFVFIIIVPAKKHISPIYNRDL